MLTRPQKPVDKNSKMRFTGGNSLRFTALSIRYERDMKGVYHGESRHLKLEMFTMPYAVMH